MRRPGLRVEPQVHRCAGVAKAPIEHGASSSADSNVASTTTCGRGLIACLTVMPRLGSVILALRKHGAAARATGSPLSGCCWMPPWASRAICWPSMLAWRACSIRVTRACNRRAVDAAAGLHLAHAVQCRRERAGHLDGDLVGQPPHVVAANRGVGGQSPVRWRLAWWCGIQIGQVHARIVALIARAVNPAAEGLSGYHMQPA